MVLVDTNSDWKSSRRAEAVRRIQDTAWTIAREQGLAALSLREVARRLGMQAPSLYSYFASKNDLYDAMFARAASELATLVESLDAELGVRTETAIDVRASFKTGARRFAEFCVGDPARFQLLFQRTIPGFEPSSDSYAPAIRALEMTDRQLASMGVRERGHADLWLAILSGLLSQQLSNDPGGDRWLGLLDDAVEMFCDHVDIPPQRRARRRNG